MMQLVTADSVCFSYGRQPVLTGVNLAVHPGEITALVGPNGAGKTTLLRVLAGLLVPQAGRVRALVPRPRAIAYLAQSEDLPPDWSVREVVELGRLPYSGLWRDLTPADERAVRWAMDRTGTLAMAERVIATLSGGERQRVALARALAQEPRVLLLDEPTAHLDLRRQVDLCAALRAEAARGVGIVAVVHDLGLAGQADQCLLLAGGEVRAKGPPARVLTPDLFRNIYGTEVEVFRAPDGRIVIAPTWSARTTTPPQHEQRKMTDVAESASVLE